MPHRSDEVRRFLSEYPAAVHDVAVELRDLIRDVLPEARETLDRPARIVGYGFGPGYADMICTIIPSKTGVKLGIVNGATLSDPHHLLEGSGKKNKYVALETGADLKQPGLRPLLKAAVAAWKAKQ